MLDKMKLLGRDLANKFAEKATEMNTKVAKQNDEDKYIVGLDIGTEYMKALIGR